MLSPRCRSVMDGRVMIRSLQHIASITQVPYGHAGNLRGLPNIR